MKLRGSLAVVVAGLAFATTALGIPFDRHFGDGTFRVGTGSGSVKPGTYRARGGSGCYWERLRNFSGGLNSILANENAIGPAVVTILPSDRGFGSHDCGGWTSNLSRITRSMTRFGNGTYIVRTDVAPGTYRARGGDGCYWQRMRNFTGSLNSIIANDNPSGAAIVTISRSDAGFSSHNCGTWTRF